MMSNGMTDICALFLVIGAVLAIWRWTVLGFSREPSLAALPHIDSASQSQQVQRIIAQLRGLDLTPDEAIDLLQAVLIRVSHRKVIHAKPSGDDPRWRDVDLRVRGALRPEYHSAE